jgi:hypothetical protein
MATLIRKTPDSQLSFTFFMKRAREERRLPFLAVGALIRHFEERGVAWAGSLGCSRFFMSLTLPSHKKGARATEITQLVAI